MSLIEKFGFGPAARAQRDAARFNLKLKKKNKKKKKASSRKPQASGLTACPRDDRIKTELV
jgi:hypothetical protein